MSDFIDLAALKMVIQEAKKVATQYRQLTRKPLGITGEIGEFVAADLLNLKLTEARQPGYDAVAPDGHRIQIKARCVLLDSSQSQRVGSINFNHDWDTVMLVLMDANFEPTEIYEATREAVQRALMKPGSKARNERRQLGLNKLKEIAGPPIWPKG